MDYQVSARKYRPGTFDDVIGQPHVVQALMNAVSSKRIAHAFLFSGTRGVGKTTVARILAKALNCEQGQTGQPCGTCLNCTEITQGSSVDVVEIDGASNTSVDDVREIRENAKFTPFRGAYRVYIIDEVHMLSNSAFNALLKILEEPPSHVVFIFATTELHKIPATILSRCQHYNFRRLSRGEIIARLETVAAQDAIQVEPRSLALLARASEGSMRDGLSLFDQAVALCGTSISHEDLESLLGAVPQEHVHALIDAIAARDSRQAVQVIATLLDHGQDLRAYCAEVVEYLRNLLVAAVVPSAQDLRGLIEASTDDLDQLVSQAKTFTPEQLQELFRLFAQAEDALRQSLHPRFTLEVAAIKATRLGPDEVRPAVSAPLPKASVAPASARRDATQPMPPSAPAVRPVAKLPTTAPSRDTTSAKSASGARPVAPPPKPVERSSTAPPLPASPARDTSSRAPIAAMPPAPAGEPLRLDWDQCVKRVTEMHPSIAPFLEMGHCVGIDGQEITLGYATTASVARARMEKADNLQAVREVCEEVAGRPVRLRIVELTEGVPVVPSMAQVRAAREQDAKLVLFEQTRSHPFIKHTLELFGGDVVDVRRLVPEREARNP